MGVGHFSSSPSKMCKVATSLATAAFASGSGTGFTRHAPNPKQAVEAVVLHAATRPLGCLSPLTAAEGGAIPPLFLARVVTRFPDRVPDDLARKVLLQSPSFRSLTSLLLIESSATQLEHGSTHGINQVVCGWWDFSMNERKLAAACRRHLSPPQPHEIVQIAEITRRPLGTPCSMQARVSCTQIRIRPISSSSRTDCRLSR
ncbi:unnamed protein product [Symbiodinium microadriaticum]|nr:unnamed protein product [Symbiodinium microadriaticum]